MLTAIFYDRNNNREVSNEELMPINAVAEVSVTTHNIHNIQIGQFGYKSKQCPKHANWDLYCMYFDLVFLRFEQEENYVFI